MGEDRGEVRMDGQVRTAGQVGEFGLLVDDFRARCVKGETPAHFKFGIQMENSQCIGLSAQLRLVSGVTTA